MARITEACTRLREANINVSLFIDADSTQVEAAAQSGAPVIEIHTGHFADAVDSPQRSKELQKIIAAVKQGIELGLKVNAGHGLNYQNVQAVAGLPGISELNIGHAIVARALFTGLGPAVREMKRLMHEARVR
jgi:pyridoxine 5-phosphate synthase